MRIEQDLDVPSAAVSVLLAQTAGSPGAKVEELMFFRTDSGLRIIHAVETGPHGRLRHVSVSHMARYPTWDELKQIKYHLFRDDEDAAMILPRAKGGPGYVNVHKNCFHIWQLPTIPGPTGKWEYE